MDGTAGGNRVRTGKLAALGLPAVHGYHGCMQPNASHEQPGTTWFVSRHPGAIAWAQSQELAIERWAEHLDPAQVAAGDTVIGTLPVNLAAEVCKRGARYFHLALNVPVEWRGRELSTQDLLALCAHIVPFHIERAAPHFTPRPA